MYVNSSPEAVYSLCYNSKVDDVIVSALSGTRFLLLIPVSMFILYLGCQQWRQHRSGKTASHSDIFTYNMAVMELIWSLGTVLYFSGIFSDFSNEVIAVYFLIAVVFFGETSFHVLNCVDRYLAVVHPVKYRELRNSRGVAIRNVSIFIVWLILLLWTCCSHLFTSDVSTFLFFILLVTFLVVVCFCSLSVLRALVRPGPGAGGGNRMRVDQSKQRAFFTVMAITGVVVLIFSGFLISTALKVSRVLCPGVSSVVFSLRCGSVCPVVCFYHFFTCTRRENCPVDTRVVGKDRLQMWSENRKLDKTINL